MGRSEAAWVVGFSCLFGGAMYLRSYDLPGAAALVPAALLFGASCAWVFAPFLRRRHARRKLSHQIFAGALVGAAIGFQLTGSFQPALFGIVLGGAAGFIADLWVPYVQLP